MPPLPNLLAAFVARANALPETSALVQGRVSTRLRIRSASDPGGWQMPTTAIVFRDIRGPVGLRGQNVPVRQAPLQFECYGRDAKEARLLWRTMYAEFFPDLPTPQGFIAESCAVFDIQELGAAAFVQEDPSDFPRVVGGWLVRYAERAVPVA